jgi:hypothetical protein
LLITAGLTGCIGNLVDGDAAETASTDTEIDAIAPSEEPLFANPQTAPHPAFDYPTFTTLSDDEDMPELWEPIDPASFDTSDLELNHTGEDPGDAEYGSGIAIFGSMVIVPGRSTGSSWVFDISDPENPELVSEFGAPGRDVDTLAFPDGRLYAVFATDSGVVPVWNLTNPEDPAKAAELEPDRGSHNVGVVPGTPLVYNSAGAGGGDTGRVGEGTEGTAIYDFSDPENPELAQDFENGYSCHDISFSIRESMDEYRAYCAGYDVTQIWDIADPADPEVIVDIPVHHGMPDVPATSATPARFSHLALASNDGDTLIVGDETGGGAAPACDAHTSMGPQTASGPVGNLYFYDISDETDPQFQSMLSPDSPALMTDEIQDDPNRATGSCTAHFGRIIPAEDRNVLAIGFYARGVNLVDFTDTSNPEIVDQFNENTNTWDVWFYNGYLVTGDTQRGMDIFTLDGG